MAVDLSPKRRGSKSNAMSITGEEIMARANAAEPVRQANRFLYDRDKFYSNVSADLSDENQFNAADYFEERKKEAEDVLFPKMLRKEEKHNA